MRAQEATATCSRIITKQFLVYVYYLLLWYKNVFSQAISTKGIIFPTKRELQEKLNTTNVFKNKVTSQYEALHKSCNTFN